MLKIVLASRNKKKIKELKELLSAYMKVPFEILSLDDIGFEGEIVEDGDSFEANSIIKASVPASLGYIGVADDSGLTVDALDGAPGIYSARYSGEGATDEKNNTKLLCELKNIEKENRTASFVCAVSCVFPDGIPSFTTIGKCDGIILDSPRGDGGFGYDPLFYYPEYEKTFGEMTADEKNLISHRGAAMRAFAEKLSQLV